MLTTSFVNRPKQTSPIWSPATTYSAADVLLCVLKDAVQRFQNAVQRFQNAVQRFQNAVRHF